MSLSASRFAMTILSVGMVCVCSGAAAAQKGKKGNSGNAIDRDIPVELEVPVGTYGPPTPLGPGGVLGGDIDVNPIFDNIYKDGEASVSCAAGRRRTISLGFGKNTTRSMYLDLGTRLEHLDLASDDGDAFRHEWVDRDHMLPSPGVITDVRLQLGILENVSALGAFPVAVDQNRPNYVYLEDDPSTPLVNEQGLVVPDELVDPDDPNTFSRMSTTMRMDFNVGQHRWWLWFGPPSRRIAPINQPTHANAGPVIITRVFPSYNPANPPDPSNPEVEWKITIEPWKGPVTDGRQGMVVGYLYYWGTKKQDLRQYAGAFDIRWATQWTAKPLQ